MIDMHGTFSKHVDLHDCRLRELTVHAYFGCFYECLPLREVFLCWPGDICIGVSLKHK